MSSVIFTVRSLPAAELEKLTLPTSAATGAERAEAVREALLQHAMRMPAASTWQEVWLDLIGPRHGRGELVRPGRPCSQCGGRRFALGGVPVGASLVAACRACRGTGMSMEIRLRARPPAG